MNIDPKSETPAQIAAKHSLKASGNHHDYNGSWVVDAMIEFAQSENQRLTEEIKKLLKRLDGPKPKRKCPNCNSTRIVVFTSDDDICLTCNKVLPGE